MKKIFLIVIAFLSIGICDMYSQVIKMEHGANLTWMDGGGLTKKNLSYSFMVGCDYLENDWMMLSSEIGYIKRGGRSIWQFNRSYNSDGSIEEKYFRSIADLNYFHINTTFRFKHDLKNVTLFMGLGPTIDILINENSKYEQHPTNSNKITTTKTDFHNSNVIYGIKSELGMYYHINNKWNAILNISYLGNFKCRSVGNNNNGLFYNKTAAISLGVGYRI
jgi:hypothetical protein